MNNLRSVEGTLWERNKRKKLAGIERAARALFAQKGFEGTTVREIARRAGIGAGTFFLYFPEKLDLLFHLFNQGIEPAIDEAMASLPARGLVDQLMHVFGALDGRYEEDPRLARVFVKELLLLEPARHQAMAQRNMAFFGRLSGLVVAARERGELARGVDVQRMAFNCLGVYFFSLVNWLTGFFQSRQALELHLRASFELLVQGGGRR